MRGFPSAVALVKNPQPKALPGRVLEAVPKRIPASASIFAVSPLKIRWTARTCLCVLCVGANEV